MKKSLKVGQEKKSKKKRRQTKCSRSSPPLLLNAEEVQQQEGKKWHVKHSNQLQAIENVDETKIESRMRKEQER